MIKKLELTDPDSCLSRAKDDELLFVLLGRDVAAPAAIRAWIEERVRLLKNNPTDEQIINAMNWIQSVSPFGLVNEISPSRCVCRTWGSDDIRRRMLGNDHHENCHLFKQNEGAIALLAQLVSGIEGWAHDGEGVHQDVWEAYKQAKLIVTGKLPHEKEQ